MDIFGVHYAIYSTPQGIAQKFLEILKGVSICAHSHFELPSLYGLCLLISFLLALLCPHTLPTQSPSEHPCLWGCWS